MPISAEIPTFNRRGDVVRTDNEPVLPGRSFFERRESEGGVWSEERVLSIVEEDTVWEDITSYRQGRTERWRCQEFVREEINERRSRMTATLQDGRVVTLRFTP